MVLPLQTRVAVAKAARLEKAALQGQRSMVEADSLRMQARQWDSAFRRVLVDLGKLPASGSTSGAGAGDAAAPGGGNENAPSGDGAGTEGQPRLTPEIVLELFHDLRIERAVMLRSQVRFRVWVSTS